MSVAFSPDGQQVVATSLDGSVQGWDWNALPAPIPGLTNWLGFQSGAAYVAKFSPDGRFVASGGSGGASLRDAETGEVIWQLQPPNANSIGDLAFSPDGRYLAVAHPGFAQVWDLATRDKTFQSPKDLQGPARVAFTPNGSRLIVSGRLDVPADVAPGTSEVRLYDWRVGLPEGAAQVEGWIFDLAVSPDGQRLVTSGTVDVRLWELRAREDE